MKSPTENKVWVLVAVEVSVQILGTEGYSEEGTEPQLLDVGA